LLPIGPSPIWTTLVFLAISFLSLVDYFFRVAVSQAFLASGTQKNKKTKTASRLAGFGLIYLGK